jgi:hypothetical protein
MGASQAQSIKSKADQDTVEQSPITYIAAFVSSAADLHHQGRRFATKRELLRRAFTDAVLDLAHEDLLERARNTC